MRALVLALLLMAPACRPEPTFDERYDEQSKSLDAKAGKIQSELTSRFNAAQAAAGANADPNAPDPIANRSVPHVDSSKLTFLR